MTGLEYYQPRKYVSISALCAFARCPRKFFYSSGCRLGRVGGEHQALKYGEALHAALGTALRTLDLALSLEAFSRIWLPDYEALGDPMRNRTRAALTLADFIAKHQPGCSLYTVVDPPKTGITVSDKVSDYEVPFAIDIGLPVPLVGRIDAMCRHRDNRSLWALEFKTTSELSTRFLDSFRRSPQVIAYTIALRLYHPQEPVIGGMVEGFLSHKTKIESTLQPVMVSEPMVEAFLEWALYHGNLLLACEAKGEFPRDFSACNPYPQFGSIGYDCDYGRLCEVPDWTMLKSTYTVRDEKPFTIAEPPVQVTVKGSAQ